AHECGAVRQPEQGRRAVDRQVDHEQPAHLPARRRARQAAIPEGPRRGRDRVRRPLDRGQERLSSQPVAPARRRKLPDWAKGNALLLPTSIWFLFLLVIPMLIVVEYSLGKRGIINPVRFRWGHFIYSNYSDALNSDFLPIFIRSILYALAATF